MQQPASSLALPRNWLIVFIAQIFLMGMLAVVPCDAGSGTAVQLPLGKKRMKNGIIAGVQQPLVRWLGASTIRLRLSVRKTNRDRTIMVRLCPNSWSRQHEPLRIETEIEIPQGQKQVEAVIYVPQEGTGTTHGSSFSRTAGSSRT